LAILVLGSACIFRVHAGTGFEKEIKSAEALVDQERYKAAIAKLVKMAEAKGMSDKDKCRTALLLATAYRKSGQDDRAFEALKGLAGSKPDDFYLEMGETQLLRKKYEDAIYSSNFYDEKTNQSNLLFVRAMWLKSRIRFEMKDYLDCMRSCKSILNFVLKKSSEGDTSAVCKENLEKLKNLEELKKFAKDLYEKARHLYDIKAYGEDYAWYRLGRVAELDGKYAEAISWYGKIKDGTLRDAGTCYTGHCLARLGKTREALKTYSDFYESDPCGLYREEALYNEAVLTYRTGTGEKSVNDALALITKFQETLKVISDSTRKIEIKGINEALKKDVVDEIPQLFLKPDDCGNLIRTVVLPESIANRVTAPWYLPNIETRANLFRGFLLGEKGDKAEAALMYKKAMKPGKARIISLPDTLPSLLAGLLDDFYLLPGECRRRIHQKHVGQLSLACFYFVSEEKDIAREMFKNLLLDDDLKPGTYARDAANLAMAYCLFSDNKNTQAEKILADIIANSKHKKQDLYRRISYLYACILANRPSERQKVYGIFESLGEKGKKGDDDLAPKALLALAVTAVNTGDLKKAEETGRQIQKSYAKTPYAEAARTLEAAIRSCNEKEIKDRSLFPPLETKSGKVIAYRRTMVIPAMTSIEPDTSQFNSGDFIVYRIKCVARDPCAIVKGVVHHLSKDEPQIPGVKGNEIIFVRSPLLYIKNLQYDFLDKFPDLRESGSGQTKPDIKPPVKES